MYIQYVHCVNKACTASAYIAFMENTLTGFECSFPQRNPVSNRSLSPSVIA